MSRGPPLIKIDFFLPSTKTYTAPPNRWGKLRDTVVNTVDSIAYQARAILGSLLRSTRSLHPIQLVSLPAVTSRPASPNTQAKSAIPQQTSSSSSIARPVRDILGSLTPYPHQNTFISVTCSLTHHVFAVSRLLASCLPNPQVTSATPQQTSSAIARLVRDILGSLTPYPHQKTFISVSCSLTHHVFAVSRPQASCLPNRPIRLTIPVPPHHRPSTAYKSEVKCPSSSSHRLRLSLHSPPRIPNPPATWGTLITPINHTSHIPITIPLDSLNGEQVLQSCPCSSRKPTRPMGT